MTGAAMVFVLFYMQCCSPNAYFDDSSILVRNRRAFVVSAAIISGLICTCIVAIDNFYKRTVKSYFPFGSFEARPHQD